MNPMNPRLYDASVNRQPPCLYMLWPSRLDTVQVPGLPSNYKLRTYRDSDDRALFELLESDGEAMDHRAWQEYRDTLLPNGLFVIEDDVGSLVATAGAVHNPNPGRYYFPFGGELGYLIVTQAHRRRGLGRTVCLAVVQRLLSAGYNSIRLCVQEHREPAIRNYLSIGFEPFLHSPETVERWKRICEQLGIAFIPETWPTLNP